MTIGDHLTDNLRVPISRALTRLFTFVLSAAAMITPMMATAYISSWVRLGAILVLLILVHLMLRPWLLFTRELALYAAFFLYMLISALWAPAISVGLNTLVPSMDFVLIMILFGSLVAFHDLRSVLTGMLAGFLAGALIYTSAFGFPFVYPPEFSYNSIAVMYLAGLLTTLFYAWHTRTRFVPLIISLVIIILIMATTSIKTNLGIVLGAGAATLMYVKSFLRILWRNIILVGVLTALLVHAVISNGALLERVQDGFDRVSHGVEILNQRRDVAGNTSFNERTAWEKEGIKGWLRSPLFGNGVEAFRTDHGITSHATPVDLLYNFGIIGLALFYSVFWSLSLRLTSVSSRDLGSLPALIFAGIVCFLFITLSGTMEYSMFMAIFISVSGSLLRREGPDSRSMNGYSVKARS